MTLANLSINFSSISRSVDALSPQIFKNLMLCLFKNISTASLLNVHSSLYQLIVIDLCLFHDQHIIKWHVFTVTLIDLHS